MEIKNYEINGRVVASGTRKGLYNLRVEAWEKDEKYNDLLGNAVTNSEGGFNIRFDSNYFRENRPESEPDVFFKIYMGSRLLKSTEEEPILNAPEKLDVTIDVDTPELQGGDDKKNRVSSIQAINAARFLQQSDFNGVYRQYREKAGNTLGFLSDMVVNTVKNIDLKPIKVEGVRDEELVNENVDDVRGKLEGQQIQVNEVHEYNPRLNNETFKTFKFMPANLKQGQTVDLYVKDGKVQYYKEVVPEKLSRGESDTVAKQKAEITKIKKELTTAKSRATKKDSEIALLKKELKTMQKSQESINTLLKSDKMVKLLKSIK